MRKYNKIIFICKENTCISPMAEVLYKIISKENKLDVISRGLVVLFPEPINEKVSVIFNLHGLNFPSHTSKQLIKEDIQDNTLILTMTKKQKDIVIEDFTKDQTDVFTIKEYVNEKGDLIDPYGCELSEYERCFIDLKRIIDKIIKIQEEEL